MAKKRKPKKRPPSLDMGTQVVGAYDTGDVFRKKTFGGDDAFIKDVVDSLTYSFHTFGGGRKCQVNPLAAALEDKPPVFALGVDVKAVVRYVLNIVDYTLQTPADGK